MTLSKIDLIVTLRINGIQQNDIHQNDAQYNGIDCDSHKYYTQHKDPAPSISTLIMIHLNVTLNIKDTQQNDTRHKGTYHNDTQHKVTQHNGFNCDT